MSEDRVEGTVKQGVGRVQDAVGGLVGSDNTQVKGKLNEAAGSLQNTYGQVKDQAQDALDQARSTVQDAYGEVEEFTKEQPLTAIAIGVGLGLVLGFMLRGGRKVVYVRK